jgi:ATP-binding cassette subfamily B protein
MQQNVEMLNSSLLYFIGLIIALASATAARFFFVTLLGELVIRDIRRDIYIYIYI